MPFSTATAAETAASGSPALLLILIGVGIAVLLIAAFWWGTRRVARRKVSAGVAQPPAAEARRDSWTAPDERPDR
ncbi:DUF6479 family protein [Streptomyces sp. NBC_00691]|uniref:DUF6479 family protein n=1 Tax=Streptomyces sp. NBC_00691 TaxID=2903671 RepID=UPI002E2F9FA0|nr:DUF6479 family protein [Streptomyces sp. NBC_00691]